MTGMMALLSLGQYGPDPPGLPEDAKCGWRIRLGDAARIVLDVASLGIEDIQDQVRVYAGAAPPRAVI